jgi:acyl-CoA hydrolase
MEEQRKTCTLSEVMPPEKANFTGHIHGGYIMLLMDRVAYACAARYCQLDVVTVSVDQMVFKEPIHVGELVTFLAHVNYAGKSSMEIGVKITSENLKTGEIRHTNSCH